MQNNELPMNGRERTQRYQILAVILALFPILFLVQLFRIEYSPDLSSWLLIDWGRAFRITGERGVIYDRNGAILAANRTVYEVKLAPHTVGDPQELSAALQSVLGTDPGSVESAVASGDAMMIEPAASLEQLIALADLLGSGTLEPEEIESILANRGLDLSAYHRRTYPQNDTASNLLGFVAFLAGRDDQAYYGVEQAYDSLLGGQKLTLFPKLGQDPEQDGTSPQASDLVLTVDLDVQRNFEGLMDEAVLRSHAKSGVALIIQPETGEMIAMTSTTRLNLNQYWTITDVFGGDGMYYNPVIFSVYEPGSIFDMITMSAALDTGVTLPDSTFTDTGSITIGGVNISNWDRSAWGSQTMTGCLEHGLNVCMVYLSSGIGAQTFYTYLENYGFGRLTGVDLAGESAGRLKQPGDADWYPVDLGTNAFGQGLAATPLQMATAISAVLNEGKMMHPHLVMSILADGREYPVPAEVLGTPITAKTAATLTSMLADLSEGSSDLNVPGYAVAGFQGSAQRPLNGAYQENLLESSLAVWGPADDPKALVYIWMSECPDLQVCRKWSGWAASNGLRQVFDEFLIPPSK